MAIGVKEAVKRAKDYLADLFAEEGIRLIGLEEVVHDRGKRQWRITLSFSRLWIDTDHPLRGLSDEATRHRTYKIVTINENSGEVVSVRSLETAAVS